MRDKVEAQHMIISDESLVTYMTYVRTGMPQALIGAIFGTTQQNCCKLIQRAREKLGEAFVPWFLGNSRQSGSRNAILYHTTTFARTLYEVGEDVCITIWDGTYIYTVRRVVTSPIRWLLGACRRIGI